METIVEQHLNTTNMSWSAVHKKQHERAKVIERELNEFRSKDPYTVSVMSEASNVCLIDIFTSRSLLSLGDLMSACEKAGVSFKHTIASKEGRKLRLRIIHTEVSA